MSFNLGDYKTVEQRINDFRAKHPEGSLQSRFLGVETVGATSFAVVEAAAYRHPEDDRPGIGLAWCVTPGLTPYTKNSELQNAETAARGRAIVACGASDAKASRDEIQSSSEPDPVPLHPEQLDELDALAEQLPEGHKAREWWFKRRDAALSDQYGDAARYLGTAVQSESEKPFTEEAESA